MDSKKLKVKDFMTKDPVAARLDEPLSTVLSRMKDQGTHEMPVMDEKGFVVGYFDYRTLMRRRNISLNSRISTLMINPTTVSINDTLDEVVMILIDTGIRGVAVVNKDKKLVGIVTRTDVVNELANIEELASIPIKDLMVINPEAVEENEKLEDAVTLMRKLGELTVPVIDLTQRLTGMISMDQITKLLWHDKLSLNLGERKGDKEKPTVRIKEIMGNPVYVSETADLKATIKQMRDHNTYLCAIVNDERNMIGVITQKDIIEKALPKREQKGVLVQITGLDIEDPEPYNIVYEMAEKFLNRINKYKKFKPQILTFHVQQYEEEGKEIKYSIRAKFQTDKKMFYYTDYDWNMYRLFKKEMDQLERIIRKEKEREQDQARSPK